MYTAKVHHNSRQTHRHDQPKVLLTDVHKNKELFRDHLWVEASPLVNFIPKSNKYTIEVSFIAKEKIYHTIKNHKYITKTGLVKLRAIKKAAKC